MQESLIHIYLSAAILCLLLALGFLISPKLQTRPSRLLGINYGLYALQNFLAVLILSFGWELAILLRATIAMALGPAIYFYYASLVGEMRSAKIRILHFLPALFVLVLWLSKAPLLWTIDYFIIGSFTLYLVVVIRLLIGARVRLAPLGQLADSAYRWLFVLGVLIAINLVVEVSAYVEIRHGTNPSNSISVLIGSSIFLLFHIVTLLMVIIRAPLLEWMHALQDLRSSKVKNLGEDEAKAIFERWERVVMERQLYKQEGGITLDQAGRILVIPARQISQAINRIYGGSFSQYLNDCRVKAAQKLLIEAEQMPITTLMLEAGFSTKSNFNKEFQRVTGVSPSEYRKQQQEQ
ncbi:AraC family transcriptional regulator [Cellvibrio sp. KY-GH-1]|uniref:AraC family transcriptional regulator n=1 Tax=Cellvibrio sp. KY-GH-1 TaxID=2303332 RepID=UPI0012485666|nr:helix-turn-helix domain-containing protein [Cellvibrio sp. KY-GH-1]QEY18738.1 AraC family transcriptional regulator [Cellvibrio sp. KY-GH-1]